MKIKHLSYSSINMLCRCPESWRRRYLMEEKIKPNLAMSEGTSLHRAAEQNGKQKIDSHVDMPKEDIKGIAVVELETIVKNEEIEFTPEEKSKGVKNVIGESIDAVASLAGVYADDAAPKIQPIMVEKSITLDIVGLEFPLMAVIDCIDDKKTIRDLKVAGRKKSQADLDSFQFTSYAMAYMEMFGEEPEGICLDVLLKKKTPEYQNLMGKHDSRNLVRFINTIREAERIIKAEIFMPAPQGSWQCSPDWCGYWSTCKYAGGV